MKPTKEILLLIEKRKKYGHLLNEYDSKVQTWCENHNINDTQLLSKYGCMVSTEPKNYADMTIKTIEES